MPILVWVILLSVFWIDGVATLTKRLLHGKPPYEAHREHAYQRAVQHGYSHRQVTSTILLVDLVLGGLGFLAWRWPIALLPVLLAVCGLLFVVWWDFSRLPSIGKD